MKYHARQHLYFARSRRDGTIKIGAATVPHARIRDVGNYLRERLDLLAVASDMGRHETAVHYFFDHVRAEKPVGESATGRVRTRGMSGSREWFYPAPELLAFIDAVKRDAEHVLAAVHPGLPPSELDFYLAAGG